MKPNPRLEVLRSQLNTALNSFQKKRADNKRKAFRVYLGATAISAMVTVLLGLQGVSEKAVWIRNVALILSATVTLLTGFDTFFNHRALWVRYTQTVTQFFGLQARLDYLTAVEGQEVPDGEVDRLFEEMQRILADTNRWWMDQRAEAPPGPKAPSPPAKPDR
jgi:uncharacterized protein DUF4231